MARPTQERILAAASRLLLSEGFLKVSMDEVARSASVTKRTLYRHFSSKATLVTSIVEDHIVRTSSTVETYLDADEPLATQLKSIVDFLATQVRTISSRFVLDLQIALPEQYERVHSFRRVWLQRLSARLKEAQRSGEVHSAISVSVAVESLRVLIEHFSSPEQLTRSETAFPEALRSILTLFLHGLLVVEGRTGQRLRTPEEDHHKSGRNNE